MLAFASIFLSSIQHLSIQHLSYEVYKRGFRWQRVYSVGLCRPPVLILPGCWLKTLPPFSNLSCQIPIQHLLHMVQCVADWLAPFPRSQHFPTPPLIFFYTPPSPPPCPSSPYVHQSQRQSSSSHVKFNLSYISIDNYNCINMKN